MKKVIGLVVLGSLCVGVSYTLVTEAIYYEEPWAIALLMVVGAVLLISLGAALTILVQIVQGRLQANALMINAQENSMLIQQLQLNDAKTLAQQSRAVGTMSKTAQNMQQRYAMETATPRDTQPDDLLVFDSNAFDEL